MRVMLSYFIEPNPPRRGYVTRYQYASHGLRFSVRRPQESPQQMRSRLSREFWSKDEQGKRIRPRGHVTDNRKWELGPEKIAVQGSIHSDVWQGTAAQLASSDWIGVFPVTGWWRYRREKEIVEQSARYSLIVSIATNDAEVDLYAAVQNEIRLRLESRAIISIPTDGD